MHQSFIATAPEGEIFTFLYAKPGHCGDIFMVEALPKAAKISAVKCQIIQAGFGIIWKELRWQIWSQNMALKPFCATTIPWAYKWLVHYLMIIEGYLPHVNIYVPFNEELTFFVCLTVYLLLISRKYLREITKVWCFRNSISCFLICRVWSSVFCIRFSVKGVNQSVFFDFIGQFRNF